MLRPLDTLLLALSRYRPWARERMVYRALYVLASERSTKYAMRTASTSSPPRS
jgi:hypothetical protein